MKSLKCPFMNTWATPSARPLSNAAALKHCPFMGKHGLPEVQKKAVRPLPSLVRGLFTSSQKAEASSVAIQERKWETPPPIPLPLKDENLKSVKFGATNARSTEETSAAAPSERSLGKDIFPYEETFSKVIDSLKSEGNYRVFQHHRRQVGKHPKVVADTGQEVTMWCSNDYLGMGHHPAVLTAMSETLARNGAGAGGTRNIAGSSYYHQELEKELSLLHNKESSLIFNSCYIANDTSLTTLGNLLPGCVMISDATNHASLIQGIRNSRCDKKIFRHNDLPDLERVLADIEPSRPKVVVFESVYSMCGSIAPIPEMLGLCKKYGALSFLDEVHAIGMYGDTGAGIAERDGVMDEVDIVSGTLGKAVGVGGGYISASANIIDSIRSHASGFIFTTAPSPVIAAGALASVRTLRADPSGRDKMRGNADELRAMLQEAKLPVIPSPSHIIPVFVGDPVKCKAISDELLRLHSIYIQPINYPTVPRGTERLRITISPFHTKQHMQELRDALVERLAKHNIPEMTHEALLAAA